MLIWLPPVNSIPNQSKPNNCSISQSQSQLAGPTIEILKKTCLVTSEPREVKDERETFFWTVKVV